MTSEMLAGRRLITLVFDVSSMQPEDVQRAVDSAQKYVGEKMSAADLVAVATVGSTLSGADRLHGGPAARSRPRSARWPSRKAPRPRAPAAATAATDEAAAAAAD